MRPHAPPSLRVSTFAFVGVGPSSPVRFASWIPIFGGSPVLRRKYLGGTVGRVPATECACHANGEKANRKIPSDLVAFRGDLQLLLEHRGCNTATLSHKTRFAPNAHCKSILGCPGNSGTDTTLAEDWPKSGPWQINPEMPCALARRIPSFVSESAFQPVVIPL